MIRVFFHLYLWVVLPLVALLLLPSSPLTGLFNHWVEKVVDEQYAGTFHLLERDLKALPPDQWPARVEELATHFGRELKLARLDSPDLSDRVQDRLRDTGQAYVPDPTPHLWRRVADSDYALHIAFTETQREEAHRDANGTAYLIREYLSGYDNPQDGLRDLAPHFGFPLAFKRAGEVELSESQRADLERGLLVSVDLAPGRELYYGKLGGKDWVLVAGPLDDHALTQRVKIAFATLPAAVLALAVLLWLRPLWRDLKRLNRTAATFGQGDLAVRSALPKRSTLHLLSTTFNAMADGIQRSIEGQKELTHAVSHEFKTPVARLRFALEMLREDPTETDRERYLDSIDNDLGELEALIGELLTHARYDRPDLALKRAPVAFADWLRRRVGEFQAFQPRLRIDVDDRDAPARVAMDVRAMDKLINNLLANAVRHARQRVYVVASADAGFLRLTVTDDGPGIPEAEHEAVFRPFYRVDAGRDRDASGTGLGLAIVRRIAERHGGTVRCETSELGGARLVVRWPIDHSEKPSEGESR